MRRGALLLLLRLLLPAAPAAGGSSPASPEPGFCAPDAFLALEIVGPGPRGIQRLRAFRLGPAVLAGMAIGDSDAAAVARLAESNGPEADDRYCTWYVNRGNTEAERLFRQVYLPNPSELSPAGTADVYGDLFGAALGDGPDGLSRCLEKEGYFAVGCNGQKHRGPTAFGMVLAALGCTPENAAAIVNRVWGLNGVPEANRLAAIRKAHELGARRPELRARLQLLLSQ